MFGVSGTHFARAAFLFKALRRERFQLAKEGDLDGDGVVVLHAGEIGGGLPALVLKPAVHLNVVADSLDDKDLELILGGATGR